MLSYRKENKEVSLVLPVEGLTIKPQILQPPTWKEEFPFFSMQSLSLVDRLVRKGFPKKINST